MGKHDVVVKPGVTIKTRVIDNDVTCKTCISEFRSSTVGNVVGLDVQQQDGPYVNPRLLVVLCGGSQCLIIQIEHICNFPVGVTDFLTDESLCFVGVKLSDKLRKLNYKWFRYENKITSIGVDLGYLAAKILTKPSLTNCSDLKKLADKVGVDYKEAATISHDWGATILSSDDIKCAATEAYACYEIGKTLLGKL